MPTQKRTSAISNNKSKSSNNYNKISALMMPPPDKASLYINNNSISTATLEYNGYTISQSNSKYNILNNLFENFFLNTGTIRALLADREIMEYVDFNKIAINQVLNLSFITDFYDALPKYALYNNQELTEEFIESHIHEFFSGSSTDEKVLEAISIKQKISFSFIKKYKDYLSWSNLFKNKNLTFTKEILFKYQESFTDDDYKNLIYIKNIDNLINDFILQLDISYIDKLEWSYISWNIPLKEETISKCLDYIDFNSMLLSKRKFKDETIECYRLLKYGF